MIKIASFIIGAHSNLFDHETWNLVYNVMVIFVSNSVDNIKKHSFSSVESVFL